MGFLDSSVGKEPACNAGDLGSIPGLGRSPGERIGYPLQYSWTSLVVQLGKNLPAMRETWVWSLGWEDPLEKGKAPHTNILAWRIPWTVESMESWRAGHNWAIFQKKKRTEIFGGEKQIFISIHGKDHMISPPLWMKNEYTIFLNKRHQNKNFHQNKKLRNNRKNYLNSDYQFLSLQFRHQPNQ